MISFRKALKLDGRTVWTNVSMNRLSLIEGKYLNLLLSLRTCKWKGNSFWFPGIAQWKTSFVPV